MSDEGSTAARAPRSRALLSRVGKALREQDAQGERKSATDRFRTRVAILIALVSIMGAVVAWRASEASELASNLDQDATQQFVQREQILGQLDEDVMQDVRLLGAYQEHVKAWKELERSANAASGAAAETLRRRAQEERALARTLYLLFQTWYPSHPEENGDVAFDRDAARAWMRDGNDDLATLAPEATDARADAAHEKTVNLVALAALLVGALFLLTLAQMARTTIRAVYAGAGTIVLLTSIVLFFVVGP